MQGQRPPLSAYPLEIHSLGDHVRKRRLDLGLLQRDVARQLGADVNTVTNWELGRSEPALWFIPGIVRFLGYVPFDTTADSYPLATQLKAYRLLQGLSQKRLAALIGVDPGTLARWEKGRAQLNEEHLARIEALLTSRAPQSSPAPR